MDVNGLINMVTRMFIRTAVDKGIEYAASKGKPESEMTPEERKQARAAKEMAEKAQKALQTGRRFFR
jgi:hypothetical protein